MQALLAETNAIFNAAIAREQRGYDRQIPVEAESVTVDPMDQLRDDMSNKLDAQDIDRALWDHLNDTGLGITMIRKAAFGDKDGAMAILNDVIRKVAIDRAA